MKIYLKTGVLSLRVNEKLNSLIGFSSRINKNRGFLFVSKVLGKHLPTKPSVMRNIYKNLTKLIPISDKKTLFIGFAETATALGNGVFEEANLKDSFYMQSTRYKVSQDILLTFSEEHCHAPNHIFYKPKKNLENIERVILVDDEVSTGNTANNLIEELKKVLPNIKKYFLLTILNWSEKSYENFEYLSLYKGSFSFSSRNIEENRNIISEPEKIENLDDIIPYNFGRYGLEKLNLNFNNYTNIDLLQNKKVLVIGTSEFMYPPYLFAYFLEQNKINVYFQATTRSPINIDKIISSKIEFKDNYFENIDNFLYNIDHSYQKIFICYETTKLPKNFNLKNKLSCYCKDIEDIYFKE